MTADPLFELIVTALNLMNRPFVTPTTPQGLAFEFYHQFRKLWDRGVPVGLGLGHLLLKPAGEWLIVERIGEKGVAAENLAAIAFDEWPSPVGEFRHRILVATAPATDIEGVTVLRFDPDRWQVV